jgi:hypothetical protein
VVATCRSLKVCNEAIADLRQRAGEGTTVTVHLPAYSNTREYRRALGRDFREAGGKLLGGVFDDPAQSHEWALAQAWVWYQSEVEQNNLSRHLNKMVDMGLLVAPSRQEPHPLTPSPSTERGDNIPVAVAS